MKVSEIINRASDKVTPSVTDLIESWAMPFENQQIIIREMAYTSKRIIEGLTTDSNEDLLARLRYGSDADVIFKAISELSDKSNNFTKRSIEVFDHCRVERLIYDFKHHQFTLNAAKYGESEITRWVDKVLNWLLKY